MEHIKGYAIQMSIEVADHTYVASPSKVWPCFGRSEYGHEICDAMGDFDKCNELAGDNSHAEIKYGRTGVCHQTANRILIPTQQTVHKAKGYSISTYFFGIYGTDAEKFFEKHNIHPNIETADNYGAEKEFIMNVQNLYSNKDDAEDLATQELRLILKYRLGENSSICGNSVKMDKLVEIHKEFHTDKDRLIKELKKRKVISKDYANEINKKILDVLDKLSKELDQKEFEKVFGIKPGEKMIFVDPDIMEQEYKK